MQAVKLTPFARTDKRQGFLGVYHCFMTDLSNVTGNELAAFALTLITSRQNILPKRLAAPGPSAEQVSDMFRCAASAPDHGGQAVALCTGA